ncbi:hypothetical protein CYY_002554 [Polysphondylium violaceum]|uniref:Transmembrane protein n=1 Tax=Polysphondylium violaceum TaxID=133409 RepID=A0A8J4Q007_9MYCE|nr:hypothetical protein CYY_002554 [Polysphondylium violaceum]
MFIVFYRKNIFVVVFLFLSTFIQVDSSPTFFIKNINYINYNPIGCGTIHHPCTSIQDGVYSFLNQSTTLNKNQSFIISLLPGIYYHSNISSGIDDSISLDGLNITLQSYSTPITISGAYRTLSSPLFSVLNSVQSQQIVFKNIIFDSFEFSPLIDVNSDDITNVVFTNCSLSNFQQQSNDHTFIKLSSTPDMLSLELNNCTIENNNVPSLIQLNNSIVSFVNTIFTNNTVPNTFIFIENSEILVLNSTFTSNFGYFFCFNSVLNYSNSYIDSSLNISCSSCETFNNMHDSNQFYCPTEYPQQSPQKDALILTYEALILGLGVLLLISIIIIIASIRKKERNERDEERALLIQ